MTKAQLKQAQKTNALYIKSWHVFNGMFITSFSNMLEQSKQIFIVNN